MTEASAETDGADHVTALRQRAAELEAELRALRTSSAARLVEVELRAEALRVGMIDLDCLKLIEIGDLKGDDTGRSLDAVGILARLRQNKPWLFGAPHSSGVAVAPAATPPRRKAAQDMTLEEWRAARSELIRRR